MKKIALLSLIVLALGISAPAIGQDENPWPARSTGISIYGSTLGSFISIANISIDRTFERPRGFSGFSAGLTGLYSALPGDGTVGAHFTFNHFTGKSNHHFESRLGLVITAEKVGQYFFGSNGKHGPGFVPVISLGYRYQKPGSLNFFRIGINTAGIGIGFGFILSR
jgi:hypothetical protein